MHLLRTIDAARVLCVSRGTMERWRATGTGPTYRRHGGIVVYEAEDLAAWSAAQASTLAGAGRHVRVLRKLAGESGESPRGPTGAGA